MILTKVPSIKQVLLLVTAVLLFFIQHELKKTVQIEKVSPDKQEAITNFNEDLLAITTLGQKRMLSSLLWVHTLMESDIERYQLRDLQSWMYLRFNTITELDPYFYDAYIVGGKYLSVIKDDITGAKEIFDKGIRVYPNDYWLNFYSGFHYYFELDDPEMAVKRYEVALRSPLYRRYTPYLPSMVSKIKAQEDGPEAAYQLLLSQYLSEGEDSEFKKHQEQTLYALKAEIDLICLNRNREQCDRLDFRGKPYTRDSQGYYHAQDDWQIARPSKRAKKKEEAHD